MRPTRPRLGFQKANQAGSSAQIRGRAARPRAITGHAWLPSLQAERAECTFVFVTPRNWPAKTDWAKGKNAAGDWKAVRAFDASDLEQWVEESVPAQMWLAEQLALPVSGFETLDQCWRRWEEASDPKMTPALFEPSIVAYRDTFKKWLEKPSEKQFVVAADSTDEALAFLSCLFQDDRHRCTASRETSRQYSSRLNRCAPWQPRRHRSFQSSTPKKRNTNWQPSIADSTASSFVSAMPLSRKPDIALDLLNYDGFKKALAEMGIKDDRVERLARESGRSPTILLRRLSKIEAIRKPQWAGDVESARSLIPMALVGAWHAKADADCEVVSTLAGRPYQEIEKSVAESAAI